MSRKRNKNTSNTSAVLDVVILTSGRFDMLKKCLKALRREAKETPLNIYLIDNGSPSEERIENQDLFIGDDLQTKRLVTNIGFPRGANEGARMGKAPLILFLSDDVEVTEHCIDKMVRKMDEPDIGICGAKLLFPEDSTASNRPATKVQHVGLAMDAQGNVMHPLIGWSKENPKTCISRDAFATTGACFMIRRKLFSQAGGFDEIYGMGTYEDVSLCLQVRALGSRIWVETDAIAYHYVGATVEKLQQGFPLQQNKAIFQAKWANSGLFVVDNWSYF